MLLLQVKFGLAYLQNLHYAFLGCFVVSPHPIQTPSVSTSIMPLGAFSKIDFP